MVVGNNSRAKGNISNKERDNCQKGSILRKSLRLSLSDHEMYRPRKEEWFEDNYIHVNRNE